ncbi:MAG: acyl-CoA thioesterase [Paracoccaceae bacterium]
MLFKHCDPAGIVFYPRYFEIINDCVETFFDDVLGHPFENLLIDGGVPTARIQADFTAPSRHGDQLRLELRCVRLGKSSMDLHFRALCGDQTRLSATMTLVHVNKSGKPARWPDTLREIAQRHVEGDA